MTLLNHYLLTVVCFILLNSMASSRPLHRTIMKRQIEDRADIGATLEKIVDDTDYIYGEVLR